MDGDYNKLDFRNWDSFYGFDWDDYGVREQIPLAVGEAINENLVASQWLDRRAARVETMLTELIWQLQDYKILPLELLPDKDARLVDPYNVPYTNREKYFTKPESTGTTTP